MVYIFKIVIRVKNNLNWFLLYLKIETALPVGLKRTWNTVHIGQILSSFFFSSDLHSSNFTIVNEA
jgi:hypothetical protein